ncbi:MAG: pyrroloquinoline quinone-dependent dehydrogenase, partial [Sphingomonadales bacterium]
PPVRRVLSGGPTVPLLVSRGGAAALAGAVILAVVIGGLRYGTLKDGPAPDPTTVAQAGGDDWPEYGNTPGGTRHSPLDQINTANVRKLEVAWTYTFGEPEPYGLQVTPIKIGERLYACTSRNLIVALDPETGDALWRHDPDVDMDSVPFRACRTVAYYRVPGVAGATDALCAERIFTATVDARLIALDAATGERCEDFGNNGEISMLEGLGPVDPGYYYFNGGPTVARGKVVLGATITDNQYWGQPSGVIRAIDAVTGTLAWAYDVGRPDRTGAPEPGESYTHSTPNSWAQMAYDDNLGLVYVATGNATPDYFGGQRRAFDEEIASAVMALDIETGRRQWVVKTVHNDVWDYDVAAQPVLVDLVDGEDIIPALIQPTKQGQLFMVDRRNGAAVAEVAEKPVPMEGGAHEERLSPAQPFSVGMPSLAGEPLTEAMMWGLSPVDQMWCRLRFREARYEGPFTPPGVTPSIQYPGYLGGVNWGGASVDAGRGILVTVAMHLANRVRLVPREEADAAGAYPMGRGRDGLDALRGILSQDGTPYGAVSGPFLSPLGVPCQQPPWSRLVAIDFGSRTVLWSRPLGTGRDSGPLGVRSGVPLTIGVPALGGAITTGGGLTFVGASADRTFRAFETTSGRLLWEARLPESGNATPMTYRGAKSGRQFVVIAAGGHKTLGTKSADDLVAFSLPEPEQGNSAR